MSHWGRVFFAWLCVGFASIPIGCGPGGELDADLKQARDAFSGPKGKEDFLYRAGFRQEAWEALAKKGDPKGQYLSAICRLAGTDGNPAPAAAYESFRKAADQGFAPAITAVGNCYENGSGVDRDPVAAVGCYRQAAAKGDAWAEHHLGICYREGVGVERDLAAAARWDLAAAKKGLAQAQTAIGFALEKGLGVEKNEKEAVAWYRQAADQDDDVGQINLGVCAARGVGMEVDRRLAKEQLNKAARQGNLLAVRYLREFGLDRE